MLGPFGTATASRSAAAFVHGDHGREEEEEAGEAAQACSEDEVASWLLDENEAEAEAEEDEVPQRPQPRHCPTGGGAGNRGTEMRAQTLEAMKIQPDSKLEHTGRIQARRGKSAGPNRPRRSHSAVAGTSENRANAGQEHAPRPDQTPATDKKLIVVANREPYIHRYKGDVVECLRPASGMATAIDPMMLACGGTWVAHGRGDADRLTVDADDRVRVPPRTRVIPCAGSGSARSRRRDTITAWPTAASGHSATSFSRAPSSTPPTGTLIEEVNSLFADAVLEEAEDQPAVVFIQDYHFGLLPRMLKQRIPT